MALVIPCLRDIEHGEYRRGDDEQCRVHEVTSGTDPLANSERQSDRRVVFEVPIFVKKSLWLEFLWVWVFLCIVKDCPRNSQMYAEIYVRYGYRTMRWLPPCILSDQMIKQFIQGQTEK